ncbi:MAG: N-acetyl-gamma-glutamyl-phosphate reductase [Fibrobacterota bacterium]
MVKVGIIGASGFTGAELLKIFRKHREAEICFVTSRAGAGKKVGDLYPELASYCQLEFIHPEDADLLKADIIFSCLPHGGSFETVKKAFTQGVRVVDLSADTRFKKSDNYSKWYDSLAGQQSVLDESVYGLPEINREKIKNAMVVGNPGCYATSLILPLFPLVSKRLIDISGIICDSKSGVSGAGRGKAPFCDTNENFNAYKAGRSHRHIGEVEEVLFGAEFQQPGIIFTPHLLPLNRGILSTIYVKYANNAGAGELAEALSAKYENEPFVTFSGERLPSISEAAGNNMCIIGLQDIPGTDGALIVSVIDNLLKGASGQAVQNMNIMTGINEEEGLI